MLRFTIYGRLPGLNEYTSAMRANKYKGASMKRKAQDNVLAVILAQIGRSKAKGKVFITYEFYEPNMRRDMDNVSAFAHKVIQDALVEAGTLKDDGWGEISGMRDWYFVSKQNPRIEVTLEEVEDEK